MNIFNKKVGIGSAALILSIVGILFITSFKNGFCLGDEVLRLIGLEPWSNGDSGTHNTIFYSIVFFIPSLILSIKYKNHFGARVAKFISMTMIIVSIVIIPFSIVGINSYETKTTIDVGK